MRPRYRILSFNRSWILNGFKYPVMCNYVWTSHVRPHKFPMTYKHIGLNFGSDRYFNVFHCFNFQVYLVSHMCPGANERDQDEAPTFQDNYSAKYLEMIRNYAHIIVGQFCGHLHSDTFRIVYDQHSEYEWGISLLVHYQPFIASFNVIIILFFSKQLDK